MGMAALGSRGREGCALEGMSSLVVTDSRWRAAFGPGERAFKVIELDGGALLLKPARVSPRFTPSLKPVFSEPA